MNGGLALLICSVHRLSSILGLWEGGGGRKRGGCLHSSHLPHPKTSQGLNKHQLPSFLPLKKPWWLYSQNPGTYL